MNIITIIILRRDAIPNSLTFFLISLNLCDLLATQPSVILAFMYYHLTARFSDSIVFYKIYQFIKVFINPFGLLFSMCSNWLVTLAAFYRFISIKYPIRSRVFDNKKYSIYFILCLLLCGTFGIIPMFSLVVTKLCCTLNSKQVFNSFTIDLNSDMISARFYMIILNIFFFYVPWTINLVLFIFLLKLLRNSEPLRNPSILSSSHGKTVQRFLKRFNIRISIENKAINRITLMVSILSFIYLICQFFTFILIKFEITFNEIEISFFLNDNNQMSVIYGFLFNHFFIAINHNFKFFVYYFVNQSFKRNFMNLFNF